MAGDSFRAGRETRILFSNPFLFSILLLPHSPSPSFLGAGHAAAGHLPARYVGSRYFWRCFANCVTVGPSNGPWAELDPEFVVLSPCRIGQKLLKTSVRTLKRALGRVGLQTGPFEPFPNTKTTT